MGKTEKLGLVVLSSFDVVLRIRVVMCGTRSRFSLLLLISQQRFP